MGGLGVQMAMAVDNALLWDKSNAAGAPVTPCIFNSSSRRRRRMLASSSARSKKTRPGSSSSSSAFDDPGGHSSSLCRAFSSGLKSGAVSAGSRLGSLSSEERREEDDAIFWDKQKLCEAVERLESGASFVSSSSYVRLLRACGELRALEEGRRVHSHIAKRGVDRDLFVRYAIIRMYLKCRGLADARHLFFGMKRRDVVIWTEMIAAHARIGQCDAALELYQRMRVEGVVANKVTFLTLLGACSSPEKLPHGRLIHSRIVERGLDSDVAVGNAVMKMYVSCGSLADATRSFEAMAERDVVSWTTMIVAYGQEGIAKEALRIFKEMLVEGVKPDEVACVAVLNACGSGMELAEGRWIHRDCILQGGFHSNVVVASNLVNMYGKCGSLDEARAVFNACPRENVVLWTSMVAAYAQNGHAEALHLFRRMQLEGIRPNKMTFATVMNWCAGFAALAEGKMIHALIVEAGVLESDAIVGNSIVTMYGKCGILEDAQRMFDRMPVKEANSWNAMITAYAGHGHYEEALELFWQMQQLGEKPNNITLVGVLSACAHAGLVDDGCEHFVTMDEYFGIKPSMQHCGCMVDLLGRAGWVKEAEDFIKRMPFQPDAAIWTALFGACRMHGDVERGKRAARRVIELEPDNTGMRDFLTAESYAGRDREWNSVETEGDDLKEVCDDLKTDKDTQECATAGDVKEENPVEATTADFVDASDLREGPADSTTDEDDKVEDVEKESNPVEATTDAVVDAGEVSAGGDTDKELRPVEATEYVEVDKICATAEDRQESATAVYRGDEAAEDDGEESNPVEATVAGHVVAGHVTIKTDEVDKVEDVYKESNPFETTMDAVVDAGALGKVSARPVEATEDVEVDTTGEDRQKSATAVHPDDEEESNPVEATVIGHVVEAGDLREGSADLEKYLSPVEATRDDVVEGGDLGEVSTDLNTYEDTQQRATATDEDDKDDNETNPVGSTVELQGVSADEDTQQPEDDNKELSPELASAVVEIDETFTGLKTGEDEEADPKDAFDHDALAKKVLWLIVMTVVIRGCGLWSIISGMHHQGTC